MNTLATTLVGKLFQLLMDLTVTKLAGQKI